MIGSVSDMDIRHLKLFVTVARSGGFAAAQTVLNVSQANISMQMKQLEERLGVRLCHRGRSGFWLTEEGKEVLAACQTLFRSIDEFRTAVAFTAGRLGGRLHVSVIDNSVFNSAFRLNDAIASLKVKAATAEVVLYVVAPTEVEQMVFDGSCDIGIGFFPARRQGLNYYPLFTSRMDLYCGRSNRLFDRAPDKLTLEDVWSVEHAARGYVSPELLPNFEKHFHVGASSSTVEGLLRLVMSGIYTAYLPEHYASQWAEGGEIQKILPDRLGYESVYELITRKDESSNRLLLMFTDILKSLHPTVVGENFGIGTTLWSNSSTPSETLLWSQE